LLGQLEAGQRAAVVADMEAGLGNLTRMQAESVDLVLLVTEPTPRSIEVSRRAVEIISERKIGPLRVVANKVRGADDAARIGAALGVPQVVAVPDDPAVLRADRQAVAVIDLAPDSPAVESVARLARDLSAWTTPDVESWPRQAGT
jgi:CO dehydrogenase maturation factor